jgi:large subunit ribosomal protein L23
MEHSQVIIRPVVSEKSYVLSAADKYTFRVHPDAHKTQIRQAVEALFDVHVVEVRTLSVKSKPKRRGHRRAHALVEEGDRAGARGESIPIFQGLADLERQRESDRPPCRSASPSPTSPGCASSPTRTSPRSQESEPEKTLVEGLKKSGGRNSYGRKTSRHRGGGAKRAYRQVDFKRRKDGVPRASRRSSTTPTAPPTSRCCTTPTARSATSSRRSG